MLTVYSRPLAFFPVLQIRLGLDRARRAFVFGDASRGIERGGSVPAWLSVLHLVSL